MADAGDFGGGGVAGFVGGLRGWAEASAFGDEHWAGSGAAAGGAFAAEEPGEARGRELLGPAWA